MEKKVYVAPAVQIRTLKKEQLKSLRKQYLGDVAGVLQQSDEDNEATKGIMENIKRNFYINLEGLFNLYNNSNQYYNRFGKEDFDNRVNFRLKELINLLGKNKELTLTKEQYNNLKDILMSGYFTDEQRPNFWGICFDRFLKEEDKKQVLSCNIKEYKIPKLEKIIQTSNDKEFMNHMFISIVLSGMTDKISQETNTKFWDMLFTNSKDKVNILKGFLSKECENLKECIEKLDPKMKEALKLELKNDETLINLSKEVDNTRISSFISLLKSFGVTITSSFLLSFSDKLKYVEHQDLAVLSKLMLEDEIKDALKVMFEEGDKKYIDVLSKLFEYREGGLWKYVDEKYKTPKYLNPHMELISKSFGLSKRDRIGLLKKLKESEEIGEKYKACLIRCYDMLGGADDQFIDLIIDTVELDEYSDSRLLYVKMVKNGKLDEETMFNIISNVRNMKSFSGENDLKKTVKQRVYGTENKELIREFIKKFGEFRTICSKEEIDTFITKFIHIMTYEDVKILKEIFSTISSPLLSKIEGIIDMGYDISKCDEKPPYIDTNDLSKLLKMLKIYDDKRSEENIKKLTQDIINDGEKGEVIFNFTEQKQKYILVIDYEKQQLKFITENLSYHANILDKYIPHYYDIYGKYRCEGKCVGGGRVKKDDEKKVISLYDYSTNYGRVKGDYEKAMKKMLEKNFPDYKIEIE